MFKYYFLVYLRDYIGSLERQPELIIGADQIYD